MESQMSVDILCKMLHTLINIMEYEIKANAKGN